MVRGTPKCAMSTLGSFSDREHAEETRYIRQMEERKHEEIRAKMEAVLALEDDHTDKKQLVDMLEKKEKKETTLDKLQKWNYFVPLGILVGVPTLVNEFFVIDMETQIAGAFMFTVAAVYNEFGGAIGNALDGEAKEVKKAMNVVDDSLLQNVNEAVATNENMLGLEEHVKDIHALTDDLAVIQAEYLNGHEEHQYKDAVSRKLDALVALEDTASNAIRNRMMNKVKGDVVNTFKTDEKVKSAALAQALQVLSGCDANTTGKMGKDVVGDVFASSLKAYNTAYAKLPAGGDEIIAQLEKDMTNIMKAPEASHGGGNVYDLRAQAE